MPKLAKGQSKSSKKTKEASPAKPKLTRAARAAEPPNGKQETDQPLSPKQGAKKGQISSYYNPSESGNDQSKSHSAHQTVHEEKTQKEVHVGPNHECSSLDKTDTSKRLTIDVASLDHDKEKAVTSDKRPTTSKHLMSPSQKESQKEKKKQKNSKPNSQKNQTVIDDFFQRRRSNRKNKSEMEEEKQKNLEEAILLEKEEGIEVRDVEGKGRGVFSTKLFEKGDFICEYAGELVGYDAAKEREKLYEGKPVGCYMYYFAFKNKKHCVDATKETGRLGRLLNHSKAGNCMTKVVSIKEKPYLILLAAKTIKAGEEMLYDYGERSKDILESHPWLKS